VKVAAAYMAATLAALVFVTAGIIGWSVGRGNAAAAGPALAPVAAVPAHLYLTVATPAMLGSEVGPAVLPSQATVPRNSDVTVTIINFDDATPLTGTAVQFAKATGIRGTFTVQGMNPADPNGPATSSPQRLTALDPADVAHTFTIPTLGLNVPLLAHSRTTFTFHTGGAGAFEWHCMDPCGTGPSGWSGAMSQQGFMGGRLTVV
jgi:hypothetical protein